MLPVLLAWYRKEGRDLPWRHTRDPYRILVSEIMLQQTQVSRVIGYYQRWLEQFPDWRALAQASSGEVIRAWSGLGYNRRVLALQGIAKHVTEHGEPNKYEEWLALKGIGPYTAAAVSVFAERRRRLPIDTNVRRVLGRAYLGKPFATTNDDERIRKVMSGEFDRIKRFYDVPQALFDLANAYCLKTPDCARCPLRSRCAAADRFLSGLVRVPKRSVSKARETIRVGKRYPDRIYRGRILAEVKDAAIGLPLNSVGPIIDTTYTKHDKDWVLAMIKRLINDGLLVKKGTRLFLPN